MYYLQIDKDTTRIALVYPSKDSKQCFHGGDNIVEVENLPDGNFSDYLYKDGEFVYDPMPPDYKTNMAEQILDLTLRISALELESQ